MEPFLVGDRWRVEGLLARGGGSSVYRAVDLETGGEVAVKLGRPRRAGAHRWDRFEREAAALAIIGSDHVVRVLAEGRSAELGAPFLVLERLVGHDLARELELRGPLPGADTALWIGQAASALELAHGVGIVHRDLKPSNLFLHQLPDGRRLLKILDFGLVKRVEPGAAAADPDAFSGTPAYMAPEQVLGHAARTGPATDIWALGIVAVHMLTGESYWQGETVADVLHAVRSEPLTPPSRRWPFLPRAFDDWFRRSCDRVAERRFPSVAAQAEALRRALGGARAPRPAPPLTPWDDRTTATFSRPVTTGVYARDPARVATIGREAERRELAELLLARDGALVTITGAGGTGKSHLALAVAAEIGAAFPHGVWIVPLAPLRDASQVPDAVAEALALPRDPVLGAADQVAAALDDKVALVVLDGFEHLVAARAALDELRRRCPRASWLVTSRAPLGLDGEERYPLGPLELPAGAVASAAEAGHYSAIQLFVERARAIAPGFRLDDDNAAEIADICRHVDGLPLAIELAAARVRERAGLPGRLGGGDTMRATIAWSHDLLDDAGRAALRRLAVCPAALTPAAARAIVGPGIDAEAALAALVDSSLLHPARDERLVLLETVRAFGLEALAAAGEERLAHGRALDHFAGVIEEADAGMRGGDQERSLEALSADHDNILALLAWARAEAPATALALAGRLSWFWYLRGHYREGRAELEAALAAAPGATPAARAHALLGAGEMAFLQCDYGRAAALLEAARSLGEPRVAAAAVQMLGSIARERGDCGLAAARHEEARQAWAGLGDRREEARSLNYLAFAAWISGRDLDAAHDLAARALDVFIEIGDREGRVWSRLNRGAAAHYRGAASRDFEDAFSDAVAVRYPEGIAWSLNLQGLASLARREHTRARAQLRASLRLHRRLGDLWRLGSVLEALARVALDEDDAGQAAFLLGAARAVRRRLGVPVPAVERPLVDALAGRLGDAPDLARGERAPLEEALAAVPDD